MSSVSRIRVVFEDEDVIAVDKPAGLLTQGDSSGDPDLLNLVRAHIRSNVSSDDPFVGLIHRLDKPVAGILIFAKTKRAAALINRQFNRHSIRKTYLAVVENYPGAEGEYRDYLVKEKETDKKRVVDASAAGAKYAELSFRTIQRFSDRTLIEVELKTGRSHQIRLQFSSRGFPILGDTKYGSRHHIPSAIALWACRLVFAHPRNGRRTILESTPPDHWLRCFPD